ncbi:MAG: hypothetical protein FVQ81_02160 [Candidatus Glassbacteria bacterium]|nr:hypothetical protein [Candidatus Glassbacteria bacterium]
MSLNVIGSVIGIVDKVIDSIFPSDNDKAQAELIKAEARKKLIDASLQKTGDFRKFMLLYEGRASDLNPWMASFRASLRPVVSYAVYGTVVYLTWTGAEVPQMMWNLVLIVTAFWFGERAVTNVAPAIKDMMGKKE